MKDYHLVKCCNTHRTPPDRLAFLTALSWTTVSGGNSFKFSYLNWQTALFNFFFFFFNAIKVLCDFNVFINPDCCITLEIRILTNMSQLRTFCIILQWFYFPLWNNLDFAMCKPVRLLSANTSKFATLEMAQNHKRIFSYRNSQQLLCPLWILCFRFWGLLIALEFSGIKIKYCINQYYGCVSFWLLKLSRHRKP